MVVVAVKIGSATVGIGAGNYACVACEIGADGAWVVELSGRPSNRT